MPALKIERKPVFGKPVSGKGKGVRTASLARALTALRRCAAIAAVRSMLGTLDE
jgi:hypothetical protein